MNKRQSNYELLRIIAMLMIVCLHYLSKGGMLGEPSRENINSAGYVAWLIEAFCLVAVNVYVIISGYFGCATGQNGKLPQNPKDAVKRPVKIWKQVISYSVVIGFITFVTGLQQFDIYRCFNYIFPIVTEHYWFATAYVILCLLMPFFNVGISHIGQKAYRKILIVMLIIFSVSKTVIPMQLPIDKYGYDVYWFIVLYLTGAYIRHYGLKYINNRTKSWGVYIVSQLIIFFSFVVIRFVYIKTGSFEAMINYGYAYNYLFCYTGAIGLFMAFKYIQPKHFTKIIEPVASATFGVYLIHEHVDIRYSWPKWFGCNGVDNSTVLGFLTHMIGTVLTVYAVCTVIELTRIKLSGLLRGIINEKYNK